MMVGEDVGLHLKCVVVIEHAGAFLASLLARLKQRGWVVEGCSHILAKSVARDDNRRVADERVFPDAIAQLGGQFAEW